MNHHAATASGTGRIGLFLLLATSLWLALPAPAEAQGGRRSDRVLYPYSNPMRIYIGAEAGYGWWSNSGDFLISDGDRTCVVMDAGDGAGRTLGAKAMIYLNSWLFVSPRVRQEIRSGKATTPLPGEPVRDRENNVVTLQQEGQADIRVSALALDAMIGAEFYGAYLFAGGSMSLLNDGTYDYSERLTGPPGFTYSDTRTNQHTLIRNHPFDRYESSTFDLRGGVGYLFQIGPLAINPEVFYSLPLTSALRAPDELKQDGIVATIGIMYNLGE